MERRKAVKRILFLGAGAGLAVAGYKWYDVRKAPDLTYLMNSRELIAALAENIIPTTDTPGAKDVGAQDCIIRLIKDCSDRMTQNNFIDGLKEIEHKSKSSFGLAFQLCDSNQQKKLLTRFENATSKKNGLFEKLNTKVYGKSFFPILKEYTVEAFCSSKLGASKALVCDYVPGNYLGCIPIEAGQKAWATS